MSADQTLSTGKRATALPAGQEMNPMAQLLEDYLACKQLERGATIPGTVVRITSHGIIVDVGAKCEGIVPEQDLEKIEPAELAAIREGDEVLVYVVNAEDENGNVILSLSRTQLTRDWQEVQAMFENQEVIECPVTGCNKGGVIVQVGKVRGFVPGSQLDGARFNDPRFRGAEGEARWATLIGSTLHLKIIEVDQERNRLILSERTAMLDWRKHQRKRLLDDLNEGDVRHGKVINLAEFGAFVDIGGVDGLVHLSELAWKRVSHPREVLKVGQEVDVYVLGVDRERQRVALSLKRLEPDPWTLVEERYKEGQLVEGVITRLTKWGAFASIAGDDVIEGLIHISELDTGPVVHPRDVIQPGQTVTLRVVSVDGERHRLSLSLKQVAQGEYLERDWQAMAEANKPEAERPLAALLAETAAVQQSSEELEDISTPAGET